MFYKDKTILITGVCGTVGQEILQVLIDKKDDSPASIIGLDNNETELFFLQQKFLSCQNLNLCLVFPLNL